MFFLKKICFSYSVNRAIFSSFCPMLVYLIIFIIFVAQEAWKSSRTFILKTFSILVFPRTNFERVFFITYFLWKSGKQ